MIVLFEIFKILFFVSSVAMGVFYLRGYYFLDNDAFIALGDILLPAYLILVGLMLGYLTILYYKSTNGEPTISQNLLVKGFIGGLMIGVLFALLYIFVK